MSGRGRGSSWWSPPPLCSRHASAWTTSTAIWTHTTTRSRACFSDGRRSGHGMGHRLLRINESHQGNPLLTDHGGGARSPPRRVRHRHGSRDDARPAARQGVRQRARQRGRSARPRSLRWRSRAAFLQAHINRSLHMKRTPQLQFFYDDTLDNALRLERAMKREAAVLGEEAHDIPVPGIEPDAGAADPGGEEDQS